MAGISRDKGTNRGQQEEARWADPQDSEKPDCGFRKFSKVKCLSQEDPWLKGVA